MHLVYHEISKQSNIRIMFNFKNMTASIQYFRKGESLIYV